MAPIVATPEPTPIPTTCPTAKGFELRFVAVGREGEVETEARAVDVVDASAVNDEIGEELAVISDKVAVEAVRGFAEKISVDSCTVCGGPGFWTQASDIARTKFAWIV